MKQSNAILLGAVITFLVLALLGWIMGEPKCQACSTDIKSDKLTKYKENFMESTPLGYKDFVLNEPSNFYNINEAYTDSFTITSNSRV